MDAVTKVYRELKQVDTEDAKAAWSSLQGVEALVGRFWCGRPCGSDTFLAHIVSCAKGYIQGLEEATEVINKKEEETHHYMLMMLWFAAGRTDLAANLLADEKELSPKDKQDLKVHWRNLGFPTGVREKLREVLRQAPTHS